MATITIDFKHVGGDFDGLHRTSTTSTRPIGIKTPIRRGEKGLFDIESNPLAVIKDNLKNLLLTNHGERVIFANYGGNLISLLFMMTEEISSDVVSEIALNIKQSVDASMPWIQLDNLEITHSTTDSNLPKNTARVRIGFQVEGLTIIDGKPQPFGRSEVANELDLFLRLG